MYIYIYVRTSLARYLFHYQFIGLTPITFMYHITLSTAIKKLLIRLCLCTRYKIINEISRLYPIEYSTTYFFGCHSKISTTISMYTNP